MAVAVVVVVVVAVPVAVTVALVVALQHAGRRQHSGLRLGLLDLRCSDSWSASLPGGMPGELCSRGLSSVGSRSVKRITSALPLLCQVFKVFLKVVRSEFRWCALISIGFLTMCTYIKSIFNGVHFYP